MIIMIKLYATVFLSALTIILCAQGVRIIAPNEAERDQAVQLAALLKKSNISSKVMTVSELAKEPAAPTSPIIGMGISNFSAEVWTALEQHLAQNGALIFQGRNTEKLTPETFEKLERIFGVKYLGYRSDPDAGRKPIQQYMFIQPEKDEIWGTEHPPLFAAYTGEAFLLEAVNGGRVIGTWIRRDRTTADGAAVVVKGTPRKGFTVLVGYYPWNLAAKDDRNDLPSFHAAIMLNKFLSLVTKDAKEVSLGPLNMRPLTPAFQTPRSIWLWEVSYVLKPEERKRTLEFMKGRHISRIYLCTSLDTLFTEPNRTQLRKFIREANELGIKVESLEGWAEAIYPEHQNTFLALLQRVLDYNKTVEPEERFAGFQSDVEPIALKEYHISPESKKRVDRLYVELHGKCADLIKKSGEKDFAFGMAIFGYLDADIKHPERHVEWRGRTASVLEHLIGFVDYLALMSYYDKAERIIYVAKDEIALASRHKIKAWVGAETQEVTQEGGGRSLSFYEEGLDYMEKELEKVDREFRNEPGYGGIAIHYYDSYRRLPDGPRQMNQIPPPSFVTGKAYPADKMENICYGRTRWNGKQDLSAVFRFDWNPGELIVNVKVTDNIVYSKYSGEDLWKSDHLELWFQLPDSQQLVQLGIGFTKEDNIHVWLPRELSAERRAAMAKLVKSEFKLTTDGYQVNCRIPAAFFGLKRFKSGDKLRLLTEVGDTDDITSIAKTILSLTPGQDRADARTYSELKLQSSHDTETNS